MMSLETLPEKKNIVTEMIYADANLLLQNFIFWLFIDSVSINAREQLSNFFF